MTPPCFSFACLLHPLLLHLHDLWVIWSKRWDAAVGRLFSSCLATWEAFKTFLLSSFFPSLSFIVLSLGDELQVETLLIMTDFVQSEVFPPPEHTENEGGFHRCLLIHHNRGGLTHGGLCCHERNSLFNNMLCFSPCLSQFLLFLLFFLQVVETAAWVVICTVLATAPSPT